MAIASKSKARGSAKPKDKFDPAGKVVVVGNLKGGCGKSTIAFNLAVWLASAGDTPFLVDLDPQKTLSDLVSVREDIEATPQIASPVDALPPPADGRRVLVDFGASDFARMAQVIPRADLILVPVLPSQADVWATQRYLILVLTRRKPGARIIFVNRAESVETSRETRETLAALKAMAGMCENASVLPSVIRRRVAYCRSLSEGLGVFEIKGQNKAAEEFERLAASVAAHL